MTKNGVFIMKNICPDEEMLADYIESRLSNNDKAEMDAHLSDCDQCLQAFVTVEGLVRSGDRIQLDTVPSRVTESAVHMVESNGSLSYGSIRIKLKRFMIGLYRRFSHFFRWAPWGDWHLVPIRGSKKVISEDLVHIKKTFEEIETEIEIEKTGSGRAHIRVKLTGGIPHHKGIRVTLNRGEREISSHPFIGDYVLFEEVPFGHYSLTFSRNGLMLGKYLFEIKET